MTKGLSLVSSLIASYLSSWRNSFTYTTKASRYEFCCFTLTNIIVVIILIATHSTLNLYLPQLFILIVTFPSISLISRRLNDVNRSGWLLIVGIIATFAGSYLILIGILAAEFNKKASLYDAIGLLAPGAGITLVGIISLIATTIFCLSKSK